MILIDGAPGTPDDRVNSRALVTNPSLFRRRDSSRGKSRATRGLKRTLSFARAARGSPRAMSSNVEGQPSNVEGAGDVPLDLGHHGGIIEALLVRLDSYPAETMRALGEAYLVVEGSIDRDRLAARRRIIRRFGDIVPYVSSDDDDERAAAQRLLVSLWPAGTHAAAALCAPHVDVIVRSLKFESFPDPRRPEPGWTLSAWVDFVIGAVGVRGLVNDYRFPDLDGGVRVVWTSAVLAHLGPAAFEEHAGMLISILGDADMDIDAHWNNHDEISRLLQMLDPKVLASHTGHLIAGMLTAQYWAASEFFPEVFAKFSPDAQEDAYQPTEQHRCYARLMPAHRCSSPLRAAGWLGQVCCECATLYLST